MIKFQKHILLYFFLILIGCERTQLEWEDPTIFQINKEPPRAHFFTYNSISLAKKLNPSLSNYFQSLNGDWKFSFSKNIKDRPKNFYKSNYDDSDWSKIMVPGNWELQGWSFPIYLDEEYPFPVNPPFVPHDYNAVGSYRKAFNIPKSWEENDIFLRLGSVRSAFYIWVNGEFVGYSQGSKTPADFNISEFVNVGENNIAIQVSLCQH